MRFPTKVRRYWVREIGFISEAQANRVLSAAAFGMLHGKVGATDTALRRRGLIQDWDQSLRLTEAGEFLHRVLTKAVRANGWRNGDGIQWGRDEQSP